MRWARRLLLALAVLATIVALALVAVDTGPGHRLVADGIGRIRTANGLRFSVGRIDGSLYGQARLDEVRVYDPQGLFLRAPVVLLDWRPFDWFRNRLTVRRLAIERAELLRTPRPLARKRRGPVLPGFDIAIGELTLARFRIAAPVLGRERIARVQARADIRAGRALVEVAGTVAGSDRLSLRIDAEPERDRFDLAADATGVAGGVLAAAVGRPVAVTVAGDGSWTRWAGRGSAVIGGVRVADLRLSAVAGRYGLAGTLAPAPLLKGRLQRLTSPRVIVDGWGTLVRRQLDGELRLRSPALMLAARGIADLAGNRWRDVRIRGRLDRPAALFRNMSGQDVALRAVVDGPLARPRLEWRLLADRFAFDRTGFEGARAGGVVRFTGQSPVVVPLRFTAARVTGVGEVAGGILCNLVVEGPLRVTSRFVTGDGLRLRSDRLAGGIALLLDLRDGRYWINLNGGLNRYLIPGLGLVDVRSSLRAVPGAGGRGFRVVGQGSAAVLRLDNGFFRSLTGGLPRVVAGLERGTDGILYLRGLRLTSPLLQLQGNGLRRRDGTFRFEGGGTHARYGPVRLVLDGRIERPAMELRFARPAAALGLADVAVHLDPSAEGFAFQAAGGSRLGPFTTTGAILLPRGRQAAVRFAPLEVSGARATGDLALVPDGFAGRLAVTGGGLSGEVLLRPENGVQRVEVHGDARAARLGALAVRRGHLDLVALLDPAGTSIEASVTGQGLRRGALSVARFAATARLRGGTGEVRGSVAGTRGRAFDVQLRAAVAPDRLAVDAQGTVDRRPLRLLTPATLVREGQGEGEGWRLQPVRLSFAGGEAQASGLLTGAASALELGLTRLPLSILDIGYPGLALGGTASGRLSVTLPAGGRPTGRADLTLRGLTRAGLVLQSRPIDMGVAGVLGPDRLGVRAVMQAGGQPIGRAQALLRLGPGVGLLDAPVVAQLRYRGPADPLWRLTGVELFDLSGPVSIAADIGGRLAAPTIRGVFGAKGARVESATTGTVLTGVEATGRFGGSRLAIDRFAADAGRGGRVTGTGQFDFAAVAGGIGMDLSVQADRAPLIARDDIAATVTGPLRFRSDGAGGVVSGDVVLDRSRYRLGRAGAATAVPRLNVREVNLPGGDDGEDEARASPWRLDVRARARGGVIVTGLGLTSEWSATLRIGGQPANPAITGEATLIRGDVEFAGREFDLTRGAIRFGGEQPADPALDIAANASTPGLNAQIRVTGTALKPEIGFTSTPALPEDELLSRLLFGTGITNLSAPEALQLAAAVAALRDGGSGLNPINAVRRAAGLDRLRILPADAQTGQGTSVAAGKYVTRRLYAEIVTDGQGYSATRVEFQVTRWLSLLSSISTLGRQSANLRVSKDY